jgi:hypothetical protein
VKNYKRAHVVLRELMADIGYTTADMTRELKLGITGVSFRLNGRLPWQKDEMYKILEVFKVSEEHMHIVFSKNSYSKKRLPAKVV